MNQQGDRNTATPACPTTAHPVLPLSLLAVTIDALGLDATFANELRAAGLTTVQDLLALPAESFAIDGWPGEQGGVDLRKALALALDTGLRQFAPVFDPATADWPALTCSLLGPLRDDDRTLLRQSIGLDTPPLTLPEVARATGRPLRAVTDAADRLRENLREHNRALLARLRHDLEGELATAGGIINVNLAAQGSMLHTMVRGAGDALVPLRLAAFCFSQDFHLHGNALAGLPPRQFHRLLRALRRSVTAQRLPLALDTLLAELAQDQIAAGHGLVVHMLRHDLHLAVELDGETGEVIAPNPRSVTARLADLLAEVGQPMPFEELAFAYRERFRRATRSRLAQRLRSSRLFVMVGPDTWALRSWCEAGLAAVAPLVDKVARRLCTAGGKQNVAQMLAEDHPDDRTIWLVLDALADDPRVRLLGRGEACPATHNRSQVLEQLLLDLRRAAGDVVVSMFVYNQPPQRQRLVQRLLCLNRLFVAPSADRIDTLTNYPFNDGRLRRLIALVGQQLDQRAGYAQVSALKAAVDRTDLGGSWLTPMLLGDLLRRHGPFELLPAGIIARGDLGLTASLLRGVRQALRDAGEPQTIDEVLRARPDLGEFAGCLRELLHDDPHVQTRDGLHFTLA